MPERAAHLHLVPPDSSALEGLLDREAFPAIRRLTPEDLEVAERLAAFHRKVVAQMPPDSELRAVALRAERHWALLAGLPRWTLSQVD